MIVKIIDQKGSFVQETDYILISQYSDQVKILSNHEDIVYSINDGIVKMRDFEMKIDSGFCVIKNDNYLLII